MSRSRAVRVLQVGPGPGAVGGMAQVAADLQAIGERTPGLRLDWLDSGGGRGRRGYTSFLPAVAAVARTDADLLHLHLASGGSVLRKATFAALARRRHLPYVVHLHGGGFADFYSRTPWAARAVDPLMAGAARVVVLGEGWSEWVRQNLPVSPDRICVVPNGSRDMGPGSAVEHRVLFVGRLEQAKGVDVLLAALEDLLDRPELMDWTAQLVGPPPEVATTAAATSLAARHPGRVQITGALTGDALRAQFRRAAVFCLPSRAEALPLTILEAMSATTAVVASSVGSIGEAVSDGDTGLLVPAGDVPQLTSALATLMRDDDLRLDLAERGRTRWAREFSRETSSRLLHQLWADVSGHRGSEAVR